MGAVLQRQMGAIHRGEETDLTPVGSREPWKVEELWSDRLRRLTAPRAVRRRPGQGDGGRES